MKLYVCWGTMPVPVIGHACHDAFEALKASGHEPEVIMSYGYGRLPDAFNQSEGRKLARATTGENWIPLLKLGGGEVIAGSKEIAAWAAKNPRA
jgi:hypothetical protein